MAAEARRTPRLCDGVQSNDIGLASPAAIAVVEGLSGKTPMRVAANTSRGEARPSAAMTSEDVFLGLSKPDGPTWRL